jgi:hypothetical protein
MRFKYIVPDLSSAWILARDERMQGTGYRMVNKAKSSAQAQQPL